MSIFYIFGFCKIIRKIYRTYFYRGIIIYEYESSGNKCGSVKSCKTK